MPDFFACPPPGDARDRRRSVGVGRLAFIVASALLVIGCSEGPPTTGEPSALAGAESSTGHGKDESSTGADAEAEAVDTGAPVGDELAVGVDRVDPAPRALAELGVDAPEAVIADVAVQLEQVPATGTGTDLLALIGPIDGRQLDTGATGSAGQRYNESGELLRLDQSALLACGQIEIAVGLIDRGELAEADDRMDRGSEHAGQSSVTALRSWAGPLAAVAANGATTDLAPLIGFLSVCAEGGYEL